MRWLDAARMGAIAIATSALLYGCGRGDHVPSADTPEYRELILDFYGATARMQAGSDQGAVERLRRAAEIAPGEPAIQYNLALLALRRGDLDTAASAAERARTLYPDGSSTLLLSALIELQRDERQRAIEFLTRAVRADSNNVRAMFTLAREAAGVPEVEGDIKPAQLFERILRRTPSNTAALLEYMRFAAENGDRPLLARLVDRLNEVTRDWPPEVRDQIVGLRQQVENEQPDAAIGSIIRVGNVMKTVDSHRVYLTDLQTDVQDPRLVMTRFVRLPSPSGMPSPPDTLLAFEPTPLMPGETTWEWVGTVFQSAEGPLAAAAVNRTSIRVDPDNVLLFPGSQRVPAGRHPIAFLDYNYDFRMDVAAAGTQGIRLYRQESNGTYTDQTLAAGLSRSAAAGQYTGVWAYDIDLEGDMDLVLAKRSGPVVLMRNNGDGTFSAGPIFEQTSNLLDMAWADLDDDGDPDAVLLDAAGAIHLYRNERSGVFRHEPLPQSAPAAAIHVSDVDADGLFELLVLGRSGQVEAISFSTDMTGQAGVMIAPGPSLPEGSTFARVSTADLDNNGGLDLIVTVADQSTVWLRAEDGGFLPPPPSLQFRSLSVFAEADLNANGNLGLAALNGEGKAVHLINRSQTGYLSRSILPRAADAVGDRRINSFGIGGEIELRSDLLYQKRLITSPLVHFGLGDRQLVDVARIIWPNGTSQAQFDLASDQALIATQSLKGSCPWVFTFDGKGMRFVTDFIWRSPLGLRINAVETAGVATTEDWVKIDGNELAPRDDIYDVRITAELWETHFFDMVRMVAVDHPVGTEIFVNEVFVFPPKKLSVHVTGKLHPVAGAWDDAGKDVSSIVAKQDGKYLRGFPLYSHQGRTREHFVELDLTGIDAGVPSWLVLAGWIRPTDSSINVALGQGEHPAPQGVRVEVQDDQGGWKTVHRDLGFPAGKSKTMLVDLSNVFEGTDSRRIRLVTNLEIYWDAIEWAEARDSSELRLTDLKLEAATLRYRGFSRVVSSDRSVPETPVYDSLATTTQQWLDLVGLYTRFGDVSELLTAIDDRYVIMNAGDEMAFAFETIPPPETGWTRDFVLMGDGWVKDGDYNTTYSKTVLPLPEHGDPEYDEPLLHLSDNPAYQRHPRDWETFHTRYVTPQNFTAALRPVR